MNKTTSTWEQLSHINVNDSTDKKGKFTYLSWTFAWTELMKVCPDATYRFHDTEYHKDDTVTVWTELTINNVTHLMFLAVMDFKNKAIVNPNAMDINKARMRCLVKNIAMFGLGIYIYAGEDLPEAAPEPNATPELVANIADAAKDINADLSKTLAYFKVKSLSDLTQSQATGLLNKLTKQAA